MCIAYVNHKPQSQQRGSPINTRLSIAILYLMIVVTMAPLPDIHGFKWVQLSPNQCVTTCHYVMHYAWNGMHFILYSVNALFVYANLLLPMSVCNIHFIPFSPS